MSLSLLTAHRLIAPVFSMRAKQLKELNKRLKNDLIEIQLLYLLRKIVLKSCRFAMLNTFKHLVLHANA
jgi:hypothetical protein